MAKIVTLDTPTLGDRSYLAHEDGVALVVDPQRDIDRVLQAAEENGVRITHIVETHIHNDYVTGGLALAKETGAQYFVNAADPVTFPRVPIADGDVLTVGDGLTVAVLATPGHTFTHLSYVLTSDTGTAAFTGGSLLYGSTGRPDLLGPDHTQALARHQYASAHRLSDVLPGSAQILPTHGFGSFCSASQSDATESTMERERRTNPVLTQDERTWVEEMLAGLDLWPAYYAHMGPANTAGPGGPDLSQPREVDVPTLRARIEAGEWVVDLRNRTVFAAGHVGGTVNAGVDGQFSTYIGWIVPWGAPLTLLGESAEQVAEAHRELVRIGYDTVVGAATGSPSEWTDRPLKTLHRATFADLAAVRAERDISVLDVRLPKEFAESHVADAVHVPFHDLIRRREELPSGEIWVHCASGYRASTAASILANDGRQIVLVDDDFDPGAGRAGLSLVGS